MTGFGRKQKTEKAVSAIAGSDTLGSWKAIANYLGRTVRTVQRWEKTAGLPVRRVQHESGSSVYALRSELDAWLKEKDLPGAANTEVQKDQVSPILSRRTFIWLGSALLVLTAAWFWQSLPDSRLANLPPTPQAVIARVLTTKPGQERHPSLSPDGRQVVYVWENEAGQTDLYLRLVEVDEHIQLTDDAAIEESPAWSPDGLSIAFLRRGGPGQRELTLIPALGGSGRSITRFSVPSNFDEARSMSAGLAWHPSGQWIAFTEAIAHDTHIVAFSLESEQRLPLTRPPSGVLDLAPAFSPDGEHLAFTRSESAHNGRIYRTPVSLESGLDPMPAEPESLPSATYWDTEPVWSHNGSELIFSGGRWPKTRLWRMAADGSTEPLPLAGAGVGGGSPSIGLAELAGQDQKAWRLVYSAMELDNDIWSVDLRDGSETRLAGSSQRERFPSLAHEGEHIAFLSDRSGYREIWVKQSPSAAPVQWTDWRSAYVWRPSWSTAGGVLAYTVELDGVMAAYVQDRPINGARRLTPDGAADEDLAWSRDGSLLYTTSPDRDPRGRAIFALPIDGGAASLITLSAGRPLGEHPTRDILYIQRREAGQVVVDALELQTGDIEPLSLSPARRHSFTLGPDGVYFVAIADERVEIRKWLFDEQREVTVTPLAREPEIGLAIDASAEKAAVAMINLIRSDLMLAEALR